jgi:mRNA-degrading endonuclease RelE of RelBE toxin-antitoxin system
MATAVVVQAGFISSAYDLPKEVTRKVFKALKNFIRDPQYPGLHVEKLSGQASNLSSLRVDDDYRIIFAEPSAGSPSLLFVGKHDDAYRFATGRAERKMYFLDAVDASAESGPIAPVKSEQEVPDVLFSLGLPPSDSLFKASTVDLKSLESLVTTHKYLPLARRLMQESDPKVTLSFSGIEQTIGGALPMSARKYRAWWANESQPRHVQALAWTTMGWMVAEVDFANERVVFRRK